MKTCTFRAESNTFKEVFWCFIHFLSLVGFFGGTVSQMATVEELKLRVRELENELIKCKQKQCAAEDAHNQELHRPKIDKMSAEVVDSNPYR